MKSSAEAIRDHAALLEFQAESNAQTVASQQRTIQDKDRQIARLQRHLTASERRVKELSIAATGDAEKMLMVLFSRSDWRRAMSDLDSVMVHTDERDWSGYRPVTRSLEDEIADRHHYAVAKWYAQILAGREIEFFEVEE